MKEFKRYIRTEVLEVRPVTKYEILLGAEITKPGTEVARLPVHVFTADLLNDSPKSGDVIARDPKKPDRLWLIPKEYFEEYYFPFGE